MLASRSHPSSFNANPAEASFGDHPESPVCDGEVTSASLLHGQREVLIRHGNEVYRLRHTRNDKLILTK